MPDLKPHPFSEEVRLYGRFTAAGWTSACPLKSRAGLNEKFNQL